MAGVKTTKTYNVEVIKSSCIKGKMCDLHTYIPHIKDLQKFFDSMVADAELFAKLTNSNIAIQRAETTLYIDYTGIPKIELVDVMMVAK